MGEFSFLAWPTEYRRITQYFGANPLNYAQFGLPGHEGVDIVAPPGSQVFCVAPGRVSRVITDPGAHSYGIHVRVLHQDGYQTLYAHLQEAQVRAEQDVVAGQVLGLADNTGNSFGSHLHLGLKKAGAKVGAWPREIIDPTPYLLPMLSWQKPAGPYVEGWVLGAAVTVAGDLAQVNAGGARLRIGPDQMALLPEGTILLVNGHRRSGFLPVQAPQAVVDAGVSAPPTPPPGPPADTETSDGWALGRHLIVVGHLGITGPHGLELRLAPYRHAPILGLVRSDTTVAILGDGRDDFLPVRVAQSDFRPGLSVQTHPPTSAPLTPGPPAGTSGRAATYLGWLPVSHLSLNGGQAAVRRQGSELTNAPRPDALTLGFVRGFASVTVAGLTRQEYTPILVRKEDVLNVARPLPAIQQPDPLPGGQIPLPPSPPTLADTTPGWGLTSDVMVALGQTIAGPYGLTLRSAPRRDGVIVGLVERGTALLVTGPPQGEYTPIRVQSDIVRPPGEQASLPDPAILGRARLGLQASPDPAISEAEFQELAAARPGLIKVSSSHRAADVARLAAAHPDTAWIVRAVLDFSGRTITPDQFLQDTVADVKRCLDQLRGQPVVVELHHQPNVAAAGLGTVWSDGATFSAWWLELLAKYRHVLPGVRFLYPGLSPGSSVTGVKQDHIRFLEASRTAVLAADGLGLHLYWSTVYPLRQALQLLDDAIGRFRHHPLWITEAAHNGEASAVEKARQYLQFWHELQKRPVVQGVAFHLEPGIGEIVGKR